MHQRRNIVPTRHSGSSRILLRPTWFCCIRLLALPKKGDHCKLRAFRLRRYAARLRVSRGPGLFPAKEKRKRRAKQNQAGSGEIWKENISTDYYNSKVKW